MYLLDTNVVSEMRRNRPMAPHRGVQRWALKLAPSDVFISAISLLEMQIGVLRMMRKDAAQGKILHGWLHDQVMPSFAGRILTVDAGVALRCAELHVPATAAYHDALIAATALVHGLTVVTRNVKDFEPMGVKVMNPWEG